MAPDRRKPPDGLGRLSWNSVAADGFDFPRNNPTGPTKQVPAAPLDFDPAACPILAEHFFDTEGAPPVGETTTEVLIGLRRERQIEHLHRLGPRAVGELLYEVAAGGDLDRALDSYERLTPSLLKALGGDRFPPAPLHEIPT